MLQPEARRRRLREPAKAVGRAFRETLGRCFRKIGALQRDEKRCFGVTMSQCLTLEQLLDDGRLTVRGLAAKLGLDTSTVTRVVDVMVRDGFLARERDESHDRRRVFVELTANGRVLAQQLVECADVYCARILARVPAERREHVVAALQLIIDAIDEVPSDCCTSTTERRGP